MKTTMFVLAITAAAFVIGCQESNVNGPASTAAFGSGAAGPETLMKPAPVSYRVIPFSATIPAPGQADYNTFIRVEGDVQYTMTIQQLDPAPPSPQYVAVIDLVVNATLTELSGGGQGSVRVSQHQEIPLHINIDTNNGEDEGSWNGKYIVKGLGNRIVLDLVHRVTRRGIEVSHLSLIPANVDVDGNRIE